MIKIRYILLCLISLVVSIHIYLINTQFKSSEVSFEEYTSDTIVYVNIRGLLEYDSLTLDYVDIYAGVIEEDGVEKLVYFYHFVEEDKGIQNSINLVAFDCQEEQHELVNIHNRKEAIGEFDIKTIQDSCDDSDSLYMELRYTIRTHFLHQYLSSSPIDLTNITIESVKSQK